MSAVAETISLKGSTDIVTEFFMYSVNSILYQRGIYPPESFNRVSNYGLTMMVSNDSKLTDYMSNVMNQLHEWFLLGQVKKLVLVIKGIETNEVLERWVFDCHVTNDGKDSNSKGKNKDNKSMKQIQSEIQAVIRQITATVTFLPLLNESCTFDLLIYTDDDANVPTTWEDSDPHIIENSEIVRLRCFSTKLHKVDTAVSYKTDNFD